MLAMTANIMLGAASPETSDSPSELPQELRQYLNMLSEAAPPAIISGHLVLSAQGVSRSVGAAFSHENWSTIHRFQKNGYGIFVLYLPLPYGPARTVSYRLVIDGLWTADATNSSRTIDRNSGVTVSTVDLPERSVRVYGVWDPSLSGQNALFYFEGQAGQRVTVAGSFNGWDPYLHELNEVQPGKYELELQLPGGTYYYVFMHQGRRISDPLNKSVAWDGTGRPVSVLTMADN